MLTKKQSAINTSLEKKITSQYETMDNVLLSSVNINTKSTTISSDVTNKPKQKVLCVIGDSIVKQTEVDRLRFACDSKKFITYTLNSSETLDKSLDNTLKAFVVHLGTNGLKTSSTIDCVKSMIDLCESILQKNNENTILISKVLPKLEGGKVNQETMKFNWEVESHYIDNESRFVLVRMTILRRVVLLQNVFSEWEMTLST